KNRFMDAAAARAALSKLKSAGLVEDLEGRHRPTELGKIAGELGIRVESVVRIARSLRGLKREDLFGHVLLAAAQTSVELDDVLFPVHKTSTKERERWQGAIRQQRLPAAVVRELAATDDVIYTARCKRLSAVLMWIDGVELNRIESSLLLH